MYFLVIMNYIVSLLRTRRRLYFYWCKTKEYGDLYTPRVNMRNYRSCLQILSNQVEAAQSRIPRYDEITLVHVVASPEMQNLHASTSRKESLHATTCMYGGSMPARNGPIMRLLIDSRGSVHRADSPLRSTSFCPLDINLRIYKKSD